MKTTHSAGSGNKHDNRQTRRFIVRKAPCPGSTSTRPAGMRLPLRAGLASLVLVPFLVTACGSTMEMTSYGSPDTRPAELASASPASAVNEDSYASGRAQAATSGGNPHSGKNENTYHASGNGSVTTIPVLLKDTPDGQTLTVPSVPTHAAIQSLDLVQWVREGSRDAGRKLQKAYPSANVVYHAFDGIASASVGSVPSFDGLGAQSTPIDYLSTYGTAAVLLNLAAYDGVETQTMLQYIFGAAQAKTMNGTGMLVRINLGTETLFVHAPAKDKPATRLAVAHRLTPQEAEQTFLSCLDDPVVAAPVSLSEPRLIMRNAWEYYEILYRKTTPSNGTVTYITAYVPVVSDRKGFAPESTSWMFVPDYNRYIVSDLKDPDPKETLLLSSGTGAVTTLLSDWVDIEKTDSGLRITAKQTPTGSAAGRKPAALTAEVMSYPSMLLKNREEIGRFFENDAMLKLEPLPGATAGTASYRLKALFGWDYADYGNVSERIYADAGILTVTYGSDGYPVDMKVVSKLTAQQAKNRTYMRVEDCGIGPFRLGMDLNQVARLLGAEASSEERTLTYSGITLTVARNIQYLRGLSYEGSKERHQTTAGIGIGATTAEVLNAYGVPDIGMEGDAVWQYMLYLSDEPDGGSAHDTHRMRFHFRNGAVVKIEMSANVGM